jgi:hypothetical protein
MSQSIDVNGVTISYPETGDVDWGSEATNFAIQVASALGKLGLGSGTTASVVGTLTVAGNTTLSANLTVSGDSAITGNETVTGNLTVNGNTTLGNANTDTITVTGIVNVDSGTLYVNPTTNKVGINDTTPSEALDVNGNVAITGNETLSGTLGVTGNTTLTGQMLSSDGTASLPGISFSSDTNTGIFRSASDQLDIVTGGDPRFRIESTGQIKAVYESAVGTDYNTTLNNGYFCRAWVNFNGTGTVAIRASGNVSSITDNGTGDYTVNFTTAMPDANYSCILTPSRPTLGGDVSRNANIAGNNVPTSSACRIYLDYDGNTGGNDNPYIMVSVFR